MVEASSPKLPVGERARNAARTTRTELLSLGLLLIESVTQSLRSSAVLLLAVLASAPACDGPATEDAPTVTTPVVRLVDLEDLKAEIAARRGKGLLINHWATC